MRAGVDPQNTDWTHVRVRITDSFYKTAITVFFIRFLTQQHSRCYPISIFHPLQIPYSVSSLKVPSPAFSRVLSLAQ